MDIINCSTDDVSIRSIIICSIFLKASCTNNGGVPNGMRPSTRRDSSVVVTIKNFLIEDTTKIVLFCHPQTNRRNFIDKIPKTSRKLIVDGNNEGHFLSRGEAEVCNSVHISVRNFVGEIDRGSNGEDDIPINKRSKTVLANVNHGMDDGFYDNDNNNVRLLETIFVCSRINEGVLGIGRVEIGKGPAQGLETQKRDGNVKEETFDTVSIKEYMSRPEFVKKYKWDRLIERKEILILRQSKVITWIRDTLIFRP